MGPRASLEAALDETEPHRLLR